MLPLAVTGYEISLFLHITAVVVGLGAAFAESLTFPVAMKLDQKHLPYVHRLQLAINQRLTTPALAVVLVTGFYQVADADFELGDLWLSGAILIVIVLGALNGAYFIPTDRRLAEMAERELAADGQVSDDYQQQARREGAFGGLAGLLVVVAIFLMVVKPGV